MTEQNLPCFSETLWAAQEGTAFVFCPPAQRPLPHSCCAGMALPNKSSSLFPGGWWLSRGSPRARRRLRAPSPGRGRWEEKRTDVGLVTKELGPRGYSTC